MEAFTSIMEVGVFMARVEPDWMISMIPVT